PSATHLWENGRIDCVPYALNISTNTWKATAKNVQSHKCRKLTSGTNKKMRKEIKIPHIITAGIECVIPRWLRIYTALFFNFKIVSKSGACEPITVQAKTALYSTGSWATTGSSVASPPSATHITTCVPVSIGCYFPLCILGCFHLFPYFFYNIMKGKYNGKKLTKF